jgi:flagellar hook-associated protein 2
MTSITTVDGLVSGLQTSSIIAQLMQVEAQPQTNLKSQVTSTNKIISAYQSVNTKMATLKTAAEALTSSDTWKAVKTTSSSPTVTATATAGTTAGSTTFSITQLAVNHAVSSVVPDTGVTGGAGLDISYGYSPYHIDVTDDTPQGVADAINKTGLALKASVLTTDQGTVLQITSTEGGLAGVFTAAGLPAATIAAPGTDAQITIGSGAGAHTVSSPTNTFTNVLPGVTITASDKANNVTVTVGSDADSIATKMQALVDAANGALTEIGTQSAYNAAAKSGAALSGDYTVRELQSKLLSSVGTGQSGYGSFKQLGIQLNRDGKVTFDKAAFLTAYNANPAAVQGAIADDGGLADQLDQVAIGATDTATGSLTTAIQSHNTMVTSLNDKISDWDTRLAGKQAALQRQFASLETALGKMKDQSSWLSSQLGSLPSNSSGS